MIDLEHYEANYAANYSEESFELVMVRVRRKRVLRSVGDVKGKVVVEVGCGMEPVTAAMSEAAQRTVVEPAAAMADAARRALAGQPDARVIQGFFEDVAATPALPGPVDVVIVSSLLHEVADPERLLAAVRSICAPDALVHVNVPNVRSFHRLLALEAGIIRDLFEASETERRFQRKTRFDMAKLLGMVTRCGFAVRESGTYFVKPFTHEQMRRALASGIIDDTVLEGLERMSAHLPDHGAEMYADLRPA